MCDENSLKTIRPAYALRPVLIQRETTVSGSRRASPCFSCHGGNHRDDFWFHRHNRTTLYSRSTAGRDVGAASGGKTFSLGQDKNDTAQVTQAFQADGDVRPARDAANRDRDMGSALRSVYENTVSEQVPDDLLDLLGKLT